jgi:hypothetical protein
VPRLSIVIPALGRIDALELSLVSVLANRPDGCEVVVVLNVDYTDPYALAGEVRFVEAPAGADAIASLNIGIEQSRGRIVHVLLPGAEVTDGWADEVLPRFDDPQLGAVAPLLVDADCPERILAAGLEYDAGGARLLNRRGFDRKQAGSLDTHVLGPVLTAAFYRREVIWDLLGGFDAGVGGEFADVDATLRMRHARYRSELAAQSHITGRLESDPAQGSFKRSQRAARLFWRNVPVVGIWSAMRRRPGVSIRQTLTWNPAATIARFAGSLAAAFEIGALRRHYRHLAVLRQRASGPGAANDKGPRRIDPAQPSRHVSHSRAPRTGARNKRHSKARKTA